MGSLDRIFFSCYRKRMKNKFLILLPILTTACETSTKTANTGATVANVAGIAGTLVSGNAGSGWPPSMPASKHQIEVKGMILCEDSHFVNFANMRVELYDGESLICASDVDPEGSFSGICKSREGVHIAKLVMKNTGKIIDSTGFSTGKNSDRKILHFKVCQ